MADQDQEDATRPLIRVRLIDLQITLAPPLPQLLHAYQPPNTGATSFPSGTLSKKVPVIRIFGTTPSNQKVCANIHGVWPYLFVDYPAGESLSPERVHKFTHRLAVSLNAALCSSLRQNTFAASSKTGGGVNTSQLHVSSVILVKGVPFYGYHVGYSYYLKISLVTPSHIHRAVGLLEGGSVMGKKFTVYEAHLAMKLQFMIDYDLYGCGWVDLDGGKFREPIPPGDMYENDDILNDLHNDLTIQPINRYEHSPPRDTHAELEIDALPWQIINRRRLQPRYLHESLRELLHPESIDPDEKLVRSVRELWAEENRRRASKGLPELDTQSRGIDGSGDGIKRLSMSQGDKGWKGGDWDASERFWHSLMDRIQAEKKMKGYEGGLSLDKLGRPSALKGHAEWDRFIMTTFESVETGWPKNIKTPSRRTVSQRSKRARASSPLQRSDFELAEAAVLANGDDDDAQSDASEDSNPFELKRRSQDAPLAACDDDIKIDEDSIRAFEQSDDMREMLENEALAEAEIQGWRLPLEFTPKKGEMPWDEWVKSREELEPEEEGLEQHLSQIGRRKAEERGLHTPMRPSQRARMSSMTPRNNPSTLGMRPFASSSVTPTRNGPGVYNPYLPSAAAGPSNAAKKSTPGSSPLNPFTRRGISPSVTPSKRPFGSRGGNAISTPAKILKTHDPMSPLGSHAALYNDDHDMDDPDGDVIMPRMLHFPPDGDETRNSGANIDNDGSHGPRPTTVQLQDTFVEQEPPQPRPPSHTNPTGMRAEVDRLEPTFIGPEGHIAVSAAASSIRPDSQSVPSTIISSGPDYASDFQAKTVLIEQSASDGQASQRETPGALGQNTSTTLDSVKSHSIPAEQTLHGLWKYASLPPTRKDAEASLVARGLPYVIYPKPFFSRPTDVGKGPMQFGTSSLWVKSNTVVDLPSFELSGPVSRRGRLQLPVRKLPTRKGKQALRHSCQLWTYAVPPPSRHTVLAWLKTAENEMKEPRAAIKPHAKQASQWGGPTQANKYGFGPTQKKKSSDAQRERQNMSSLALEVFATSTGKLLPNPHLDPIVAVFYCFQDDEADMEDHPEYPGRPGCYTGIMMVKDAKLDHRRIGPFNTVKIEYFDGELDLINEVVNRVQEWDPDVLAGWEVHASSWGYLVDRAGAEFGFVLSDDLSRVLSTHSGPKNDQYSQRHTSSFKVVGRHVFNIWRILRGDLNLLQYSFENVTFQLLHQRFPHYPPWTLTEWYKSATPEHVCRLLQYHIDKVNMYTEMVDIAEIVTKNAEFARVFGVDFNSVMSRGSQFKVESFMFRIAKPESFVLVSPSREAVGKQNAAEAQPLIMEPQSVFYNDPIVVLDFQSLYPSIMIGYNYCYSTCLGRVESFKGSQKLGWSDLRLPPGRLELLQDHITISPNGIIYAKPNLRKSLLAKMLSEILETRVMVKNGMKLARGDKALLQVLNARQLGLKLMANVTYGYTGASFSGRMPCVEIADSIVQTGRETLEKAITFIHSKPEWNASVVYGDTDSLFIHMPGRTMQQAHKLGNLIADAVTALNPKPVKLKFEKVYSASLLMAKKRYVGFKHEHIDEVEPTFDAKGIETVRRDGFPAGQKMVETCIKMLFRTKDVSKIKDYVQAQWTKLREGKVSIQDFTLAKEVKLGSYSDKVPPPPGVMVASRKLTIDPRAEAEYGERVPYVITMGESHRLVDRAASPEDLLNNRNLKLDAEYYITRQLIPPLNRIFNLIGIDVKVWYDTMPKRNHASARFRHTLNGNGDGHDAPQSPHDWQGKTLDMHFLSVHCLVCGAKTDRQKVCDACRSDLPSSIHALLSRYHLAQSRLHSAHRICASCSSIPLADVQKCDSIDCPVLYARVKAGWEAADVAGIPQLVRQLENDAEGGDVVELD